MDAMITLYKWMGKKSYIKSWKVAQFLKSPMSTPP